MDVSSIAQQGLQRADTLLETAAARIAIFVTNSPDSATPDVVDLGAEMVALMSAQSAFEVNLATLKTAEEMQKSLVDLKA